MFPLIKIFAYIKKEFLVQKSYKFAFFFNIFSVFTSLLTFFFINRLFGNGSPPILNHLAGTISPIPF